MILAFLFQISLCMTVSRSIHIFTNDPISFLKKKMVAHVIDVIIFTEHKP